MRKFYLLAAGAMLLASNAFAQEAEENKVITTPLFEVNLASTYSIAKGDDVRPTLGMCGENLVMHFANGTAPVYLDAATGEKKGEITLGDVLANGAVASDDKNNLILCEACESGETLKVYRVKSVTEAPELLVSYENTTSLPLGRHIQVNGDLDGNAQIVATVEGTAAAGSNQFVRWIITDGVAGDAEVVNVTLNDGEYWWGAHNSTRVFSKSSSVADGYFLGHYDNGDNFYHINGETNTIDYTLADGTNGNAWAYSNNCGDSRVCNGDSYTALMSLSLFTYWDIASYVCLYDTNSLEGFTGTNTTAPALLGVMQLSCFTEQTTTSDGNRFSDVLLIPAEEGVVVYCVSNSELSLAGVSIAKNPNYTGVADVVVDENAPVEYFNLQGVRVANPENGIFVRRQGNQVSKVVVK